MRTLALIASLAALAALAGCGEEETPAALLVEEAVAREGPSVVRGNLLAAGDEVRLCAALAESFPPQCGGASLVVEGLELEDVDGLISEGDVAWTDRPIELRGVVADGTLTVSENAAQ